tara:strand:+ start:101 stop:574 length:474 start_codon:yes stop_codon:yes gene_type:complete
MRNLKGKEKMIKVTEKDMHDLAKSLSKQFRYNLRFSFENGRVYFRHDNHPTLKDRAFLVFAIENNPELNFFNELYAVVGPSSWLGENNIYSEDRIFIESYLRRKQTERINELEEKVKTLQYRIKSHYEAYVELAVDNGASRNEFKAPKFDYLPLRIK